MLCMKRYTVGSELSAIFSFSDSRLDAGSSHLFGHSQPSLQEQGFYIITNDED